MIAGDQTERELLGAMMREPALIPSIALKVKADHFRVDYHQRVASAIYQLHADGLPIDAAAVGEKLLGDGEAKVDAQGGNRDLYILHEMWEGLTRTSAEYLADQVRSRWLIRMLGYTAREIMAEAEAGRGPADELVASAVTKLVTLAQSGAAADDIKSLDDIMGDAGDAIDRRATEDLDVVPTGFSDLDRLLGGGLPRQDMIVVGARTSIGKTAFALAIARRSLERGQIVFFASLEQSCRQLAYRLLAAKSGVDLSRVARGKVARDDGARIVDAMHSYRDAKSFFTDRRDQTVFQIALKAAKVKAKHGLDLVVVDYAQLVQTEDKKANRYQQIGQITSRLRQMAGELNVPVLALAQLNRTSEDRERPRLSDIRESGNAEQDADSVILLSRATDVKSSEADVTHILADVAKNRNGPTGSVVLRFIPSKVEFEDFDPFATADLFAERNGVKKGASQ